MSHNTGCPSIQVLLFLDRILDYSVLGAHALLCFFSNDGQLGRVWHPRGKPLGDV